MAVVTQIPTPSEPLTRDKGLVTTPWFQFFMHVFNTVSPGGGPAPANPGYIVTGADPSLPNARVATSSATVTVNVATPGVMKWDATTAGTGDVVGPASAVDDHLATYDGVTGKLIQDGGKTIAEVEADAVTAAVASILPVHILTETTGFPGGTATFLRADATFASPAGGGDVSGPGAAVVDDRIATWDGVTGTLIQDGGKTIATVVSDAVMAAVAAIVPIDLTSEVTGDLPLASLAQASAASRLLGRGSASGAGDVQELTLGAGLAMTGTVVSATGSSGTVRVVACHITDGGTVIATGVKGFVRVPYSGTITKVTVLSVDAASTSGSIVVDVWKDTYANYPPTNADSITASAPPTLSSANKSEDATLTGWSTSVTAGDVFGFNVDSATTVTSVLVEIEVTT